MTTIWAGPDRVFFGVGPPAVPSRIRRDAEGAKGAKGAKGASPSSVRKCRRFTPGIVSGRLARLFGAPPAFWETARPIIGSLAARRRLGRRGLGRQGPGLAMEERA